MSSATLPRTGAPLRLLVYDDTCRGTGFRPGLSHAWLLGARLYRALGRIDLARGARRWIDALHWLARAGAPRRIVEVQFWMHGRWGLVRIGREELDAAALRPGHPLEPLLAAVRARLTGAEARLWFRTCETFGARRGMAFAREVVRYFGCRAAGHTHVISLWQSGLRVLSPGEEPAWPATDGLLSGTPENPVRARPSGRGAPATISFLAGSVPAPRTKIGAGRAP